MNRGQLRILISMVGALVVLALVWLLVGPGTTLLAQGPGPQGEVTAAGIVPPYIYYQGRLVDKVGSPITGTRVITFSLYAQSSGGTALATDSRAITLTNGLFRTYIGFAAEHYNGQALWVGVQVENDPEMTPRHYLRPVPYALSLRPGAVVSGSVGLQPALNVVNNGSGRALQAQAAGWSAVLGTNNSATAGAVAGVNSGAGPGGYFSSGSGDALKVDGSALIDGDLTVNGTVWARNYENVIVVAKSGGEYTSIQAALNVITDAAESNPYLVRVMPGIYEEPVALKPFVTVQGSGRRLTVISYSVSYASTPVSGTLVGADDAGLADLSVVNYHADGRGPAIYNSEVEDMTIDGVTALASGGTVAYGIYNTYSSPEIQSTVAIGSNGTTNSYGIRNRYSSPEIRNTVAAASGGADTYGIFSIASSPQIENSVARAGGGSGDNRGIVSDSSSSVTIRNSTIEASDASCYGIWNVYSSTTTVENTAITVSECGTASRAVFNRDTGSLVTLNRSTVTASGGSLESAGIYNFKDASTTVQYSTVSANGGSGAEAYGIHNVDDGTASLYYSTISATVGTTTYGIYNESATTSTEVLVHEGQVSGGDYAIYNGDADFTVRVLGTYLVGGVYTPTGTFVCVGAYDGSGFLGAGCEPFAGP